MSGEARPSRWSLPAIVRPYWYDGRSKTRLVPPPLADQALSEPVRFPSASRGRKVPPTETTWGEVAGCDLTLGKSPDAATKEIFSLFPRWKDLSKVGSAAVSPLGEPQLIEMTPPPDWRTISAARSTAKYMSCWRFESAWTRMIFASGAMAWAHWMSSAASPAHWSSGRGWKPEAYTRPNNCLDGAGSPNSLENTWRSCRASA